MMYKVGYTAYDGTHRSFKFESSKRLTSGNRICIMTNPLLGEVLEEFAVRCKDPQNKMCQHGGAYKLNYIENVNTGTMQMFD